MRLRHGGALVLVGWYLMVPPFSAKRVLHDTPLSGWQPVEHYSTLAECEEGKETTVRELIAFAKPQNLPRSYKIEALRVAKCVATDDPRLKPK